MKLTTAFILSAAKVATKCDKRKTFTVDDIRAIADRKKMDVHPNAWGMAMQRCDAMRLIKPAKMSRSARASNHGRRVIEWRVI